MIDKTVEILNEISKETGYSYDILSSVNYRIIRFFPNISFDEKVKLLSSIIELNKFIVKENNRVVCINGYKLDMSIYEILSGILIKKHNEKNKKIEEILDEYLDEHKKFLMIPTELNNALKKELKLGEYIIRSCFDRLKREYENLNYKEIIKAIAFLLELKGKFNFIPNRNVVKIKNDFYSSSKIVFLNVMIDIKLNNPRANSDEIIDIYTATYDYNKILVDESEVNEKEGKTTKLIELEIQISENLGYSSSFFRKLFNILKCKNSSVTNNDYISCLNMVIDLSSYVIFDKSKKFNIIIEKLNYKYIPSTFWLMLFELKLSNPSMTLDDAVLKVVEQTGGNPYFSDDGKTSKNKDIPIGKNG